MKRLQSTKTIEGIDLPTLGAAIQKLRISEGIPTRQLAQDAGISVPVLSHLCDGTSVSDKNIEAVIKVLADSTRLGIKTASDVVARANDIPDLSYDSVRTALAAMARHKGIPPSTLRREAGKEFSPMHTQEAFMSDYYQAKFLGCTSIGDLLKQSANLPPEIADAVLVPATETLRDARGITTPMLAGKIGIAQGGYANAVARGRFTPAVRKNLPAAFGLGSLQDIVDEAKKVEPLPDREQFGEAVKKLRLAKGLTQAALSDLMGCDFHTLAKIEKGEKSLLTSALLRKIPPHLGCKTMQDVIEKADSQKHSSWRLRTGAAEQHDRGR